ncbi:MAG: UDP-2,3-diacylglucosamine diphosphatase [Candidatus Kapaibacteriales bacterium]
MVYFISDIHFGFFDRATEQKRQQLFFDFLKVIQRNCVKLYIVGDLFDYWFDYNEVIPRDFFRIVSKLYDFKANGSEIVYLMGNHDFGHYDFFKQDLEIEVIEKDIEIEIMGKKFFISHGDGKIPRDYGYFFLKKILRNSLSRKLYRLIHPDLGISLAKNSSKQSRKYNTNKFRSKPDILFDYARSLIENGFDFVIFGHTHQPGIFIFDKGTYVNLGSWLDVPKFAYFDGTKIQLLEVENFIFSK